METSQRVGSLDISQDLDYQRRSWAVQRVGWALMALVMILAGLGLLGGSGLLASGTAGDDGSPLEIRYKRYARKHTPMQVQIVVRPGAFEGQEARIWLHREYLEAVQIQSIMPEPESVEAGADRMTFVFTLDEPGQSTVITLNTQAEKFGRLSGRVGIGDGGIARFSQFVYP